MGFTSDSISGTSISANTFYINSVGSGTPQINLGLDSNFQVVTGTTGGVTQSYKVYTALLTQTGTSAPTAIVLENTIGTVTLGYDDPGLYQINGNFTSNKTIVLMGSLSFITQNVIYQEYLGTVYINTLISNVDSNNVLSKTPIEIRVYN